MKEIPLTQGKVALVDDEDYEYLNQWKWHVRNDRNRNWYAQRSYPNKLRKTTPGVIHMHRILLNPEDHEFVDHKDKNGLNNQKENLRICTKSQNAMNRNSITTENSKGVSWHKRDEIYQASIKIKGKRQHLGYFKDKNEALKAYNEKAKELFGEFAILNKIIE